jgi:hypothetical protein
MVVWLLAGGARGGTPPRYCMECLMRPGSEQRSLIRVQWWVDRVCGELLISPESAIRHTQVSPIPRAATAFSRQAINF